MYNIYPDIHQMSQLKSNPFDHAASTSPMHRRLDDGCTDCGILANLYSGSCGAFEQKTDCWVSIDDQVADFFGIDGDYCCATSSGACCDANTGAIIGFSIGMVVLIALIVGVSLACCICLRCCACCPCNKHRPAQPRS
uniref:Uncharacterized protein n=2 Tax=Chrysotila carterae TaxID=13221 RepID=A0A7S4BFI7_CHRCT